MKHTIQLLILTFVLFWTLARGQSYHLVTYSVGSCGGHTSSMRYTAENSIAQSTIGGSFSSNYKHGSGFMYQIGSLDNYFTFNYYMADGWNMVSVPITVTDYRKTILFPTAISDAFIYTSSYQARDTLQNGIGFWLKYPDYKIVSIRGGLRTDDTINVTPGWNLIGSIGDTVQIGDVIQIPSDIIITNYIGYNDGYYPTSAIEPGNAYWIMTNKAGKLVLRNTGGGGETSKIATLELEEEKFNVLTIQSQIGKNGRMGGKHNLFFGKNQKEGLVLERYELPPKAPEGSIDARFTNNRIVNIIPDDIRKPIEIPLSLQGRNDEPLKVGWSMRSSGEKYTLIEKVEGKVFAQHRMTGMNSVMIIPGEKKTFILRVEPIPQRYSLYQNYPNPFNPNTTILFDLPEHVRVTIKVFDILGREVAIPLDNQEMEEGNKSVEINAQDWASGVYFYKLVAQSTTDSKQTYSRTMKMIIIK